MVPRSFASEPGTSFAIRARRRWLQKRQPNQDDDHMADGGNECVDENIRSEADIRGNEAIDMNGACSGAHTSREECVAGDTAADEACVGGKPVMLDTTSR